MSAIMASLIVHIEHARQTSEHFGGSKNKPYATGESSKTNLKNESKLVLKCVIRANVYINDAVVNVTLK